MEREIWDILLAVESGKLSAIDAHRKIITLKKNRDSSLIATFSEQLNRIKSCDSNAQARRVFKAILKHK